MNTPGRRRGWLLVAGLLATAVTGCGRSAIQDVQPNATNAEKIREALVSAGAGGGGAGQALVEPQGFADLVGVFRVNGAPPPRVPLSIGKDVEVCAPGGRTVYGEDVVIGEGGGIQNVLIFLTGPDYPKEGEKYALWEHETYRQARDQLLAGPLGFDQKNCLFLSHVFAMRSTQSVEVINSDPVGHNTNISPERGAKKSNDNLPGLTRTVYSPGGETPKPFPVSCAVHPWMKAWMITRNNPYFAVTNDKGEFKIAKVPTGVELEFRVWQERADFLGEVVVDGTPAKWPKGRMVVKLDPAQFNEEKPKRIDVVVDAALFQ